MIELKDYQKKAVKRLKENIMDLLRVPENRQKIVFKAPTGAGKTVMASALLDELNQELSSQYNEAAFIWIAPNKLHVQTYMSMRNFFSERRTLRPVYFNDVNPSEGLNPGEVLFLNWESINKENVGSMRASEKACDIVVVEELENGDVLIEDYKKGSLKRKE
jgi:type III restriction enzyme